MLISRVLPRKISWFVPIQPKVLPIVLPPPFHSLSFSRHPFSQLSSRMDNTLHLRQEPLPLGTILKGDSGRIFVIEEVLADHRTPLLCVYRAR